MSLHSSSILLAFYTFRLLKFRFLALLTLFWRGIDYSYSFLFFFPSFSIKFIGLVIADGAGTFGDSLEAVVIALEALPVHKEAKSLGLTLMGQDQGAGVQTLTTQR